jgi:protein-S-isoprenylcysteine O-methyltransferase Ste14
VGALVTGEFTRSSLRAGAPLLLAGGLLALASVRTLGRGRELVTRGPYRWIRHPYFLGILVMLVGALVAMRSLPALILMYPAVRVTLVRARREEHNLGLRFGDAYHKYQEHVAFMLPVRPPLPRPPRPGVPGQPTAP